MITLEIPAPEFVKRFQSGEIPEDAQVSVTYEPTPEIDIVAASSDSWDEDAPLDGEALDAERRLFEQFEQGVNANRQTVDTRTL